MSTDGAEAGLLQRDLLVEDLSRDLGAEFATIVDYPGDLVRVISDELRLGNVLKTCTTSDEGIEVACMAYRFLDGHISSSWTEFQIYRSKGPWYAWYFAPDARRAVACMRVIKNGRA